MTNILQHKMGRAGPFSHTGTTLSQEEQTKLMREGLARLKQKQREQGGKAYVPSTIIDPSTPIPFSKLGPFVQRVCALEEYLGEKPQNWKKPAYGHIDYILAQRMGWICEEETEQDRQIYETRRNRSLRTCHRQRFEWEQGRERKEPVRSGGYIPELPSHLLYDDDLTDGAKICAARIMEEAYRANREGRWLKITVTYLMKALDRSRRTVQNYLRLLEDCGYIQVDVILGETTRMCTGLKIQLLESIFPRHHKEKWPKKRRNPDMQKDSHNYWINYISIEKMETVSCQTWARKCMQAVYRRYMQINP